MLDPDQDLNRSTQSLLPGEGEGWREGGGAAEGRATFPRTKSVTVLNNTTARNNVEVNILFKTFNKSPFLVCELK